MPSRRGGPCGPFLPPPPPLGRPPLQSAIAAAWARFGAPPLFRAAFSPNPTLPPLPPLPRRGMFGMRARRRPLPIPYSRPPARPPLVAVPLARPQARASLLVHHPIIMAMACSRVPTLVGGQCRPAVCSRFPDVLVRRGLGHIWDARAVGLFPLPDPRAAWPDPSPHNTANTDNGRTPLPGMAIEARPSGHSTGGGGRGRMAGVACPAVMTRGAAVPWTGVPAAKARPRRRGAGHLLDGPTASPIALIKLREGASSATTRARECQQTKMRKADARAPAPGRRHAGKARGPAAPEGARS